MLIVHHAMLVDVLRVRPVNAPIVIMAGRYWASHEPIPKPAIVVRPATGLQNGINCDLIMPRCAVVAHRATMASAQLGNH